MKKTKVLNLYGGPGTGKSTTAAGVFSELKHRGVNCELVQEYAKDKAWEFDGHVGPTPKILLAQEYVFAKQHFRMRRCASSVDLIITDSPLLLSMIYTPDDFELPSLNKVVREAYDMYDNVNVFLRRTKQYNPSGRFQTEQQAQELDIRIRDLLGEHSVPYDVVAADRDAVCNILEVLQQHKIP